MHRRSPFKNHALNLSLCGIYDASAGNKELADQLAKVAYTTGRTGAVTARPLHVLRNALRAFVGLRSDGSMRVNVISQPVQSARE